MHYIAPCVEQLDMAAQNLVDTEPIRSRIALILVDNVVELMAHAHCKRMVLRNDMMSRLGKDAYSEKDRARATGRYFGDKFRFLVKHGALSEEDRNICIIMHDFRNEEYHVGMLNNDIIYELAWVYHHFACRLFTRLKPDYYMWDDRRKRSKVLLRHVGDRQGANLEVISSSLGSMRPELSRKFGEALAGSINKRLEAIEEAVSYLESGLEQQWPNYIHEAIQAGMDQYDALIFTKCIRLRNKLAQETGHLRALQLFNEIVKTLEQMEDDVTDAALYYAGYVDHLVDQARGK